MSMSQASLRASMLETQLTRHSTSSQAAMPEMPATRVRGGQRYVSRRACIFHKIQSTKGWSTCNSNPNHKYNTTLTHSQILNYRCTKSYFTSHRLKNWHAHIFAVYLVQNIFVYLYQPCEVVEKTLNMCKSECELVQCSMIVKSLFMKIFVFF